LRSERQPGAAGGQAAYHCLPEAHASSDYTWQAAAAPAMLVLAACAVKLAHVPILQPPFRFFPSLLAAPLSIPVSTARINLQCKELHGKIRVAGARGEGSCEGQASGGRGTNKSPQNQRQPSGGWVQGAAATKGQMATRAAGRGQGPKEDSDLQFRLGLRPDKTAGCGLVGCMHEIQGGPVLGVGSKAVMEHGWGPNA
jgi:hypothetical protein